MSEPEPPSAPRRRGRRTGGEDTKAALLTAAREVFVERGYEHATVRAIASRAGVDAAMVNHWFGGKEGLFAKAVLQVPFDPSAIIARLIDGPADALGERVVRTFLSVWDATDGGQFSALVRSVTSHDGVATALREFFVNTLIGRVLAAIDADHRELRATLIATQIFGMGIVRYVVRFEPFASIDAETLVRAIAPNLQRYLTGDLG
ncbi:TetR family transcriptional regulator [Saccharothrix violaceirubra]|uniref:AcrR family transcriptional regulator n=1 Tax=Saccharothrix violaceirubra TaxID=413306 RepID=A0A7W7T168_9PSEU|nr:TetR family transcriptional regulator [Saccharothrix violaceirubra]MBB4964167.1 AcrR family transcriptional regulator [Saccharothrix violaceirubra]